MVAISSILPLAGMLVAAQAAAFAPRSDDAASSSEPESSSHPPNSQKTTSVTKSATPTAVCGCNNLDTLIAPTQGQTVVQVDDGNYDGTNITVIWCSGAYFKTSSIDVDVWLTSPGAISNGVKVAAGYYGYAFNITVCSENGNYKTGKWNLTVYEKTTGYYNANSFTFATAELNFTVDKTD